MLRIQVLGPLVVWRDQERLDLGSPAQRVVLGLLAIAPDRAVPRTAIMDVLWRDRVPPPSAVNVIQTHVMRLRRRLEPDRPTRARSSVVEQLGDGYALLSSAATVDLLHFRQLVQSAVDSQLTGDDRRAAALLDAALGMWHGPPLADVPALAPHPALVGLDGEYRAALARYGDLMIAIGSAAEALPRLEEAAAAHPLDEVGQARLIQAYGAAGRRGQAFAAFREVRRRLAEDLGVDPGPELVRVHEDLLRGAGAEDPRGRDSPPMPPVPAQLPPDVPGFTGRSTEIAELDRLVGRAVGTVIAVVSGTAGVGKTALAVHWAHRVAHRFPDGQIFLDLCGFDGKDRALEPAEAVRGLLDALHVPHERVPPGLAAQTALLRSLVAGRRLLIVLDNACDAAQVRPLLPGASNCLVLVTSRNQLPGLVATDGAHPLGLDLLTPDEARALLVSRLGAERIAAEPEAAAEIIVRCARLPLALAVVAARAAIHPHFALRDLATELRDEPSRLDAIGTDEHGSMVRSVLSSSYRALTPATATMFRRMGLHPGPVVSLSAAVSLAGAPRSEVRPLLAELTRGSLVVESAPGRFTCHDLLRAYAAEVAGIADSRADRHATRARMFDHYLHTAWAADRLLLPHRYPPITLEPASTGTAPEPLNDRDQAMAWFTAEHRTLVALTREAAATGFQAHAVQLAWTLCTFFQWRGHWHDQVATQRVAVRAADELQDRVGQGRAHHNLARAHAKLGRADDALRHYREASRLFGQCGDHDGRAHTHLGLGAVFEQQGDHPTALRHARQALELFRRAGNLPGQANSLNSAGWCHAQLGDHEEAIAACQEALALQQKIGDSDGEAATWDSLGFAHFSLRRFGDAVDCYRRAVEQRRALGDRYYESASLHRLGDTYLAAGDPAAAAEVWRAALTILDTLDHADAAQVRKKLDDSSR